MSVPAELRASLPTSIDVDVVRAAVRASGSPGSFGGETWLLDLGGKLAVLVRASIFDPLEPVALADLAQPVELRGRTELEVRPAAGPSFVTRPSLLEFEAITALLAAVDGVATLEPAPPTSTTSTTLDEPHYGEPPAPALEPVTLTDLDAIDPILEAEVVAALEAGEYDRTLAAAGELARQSHPRERDQWSDLIELVTKLRAGDHVAAYLWSRGVRQIPASANDALLGRLSNALEQRDEPTLAWAAAGQLLLDESGSDRRARIERRLDRDGPTLAREVSTRARSFFAKPAEAGDRLAQRGLARALLELDELDAALTWIRRATAAERFDFHARMLETEILALRAIETDDPRELRASLQKVADDFHDRPEPLVDLAEHVEYDDPDWAIELLRKAQAREYDEFVLLDLVELLEHTGRHAELVSEIERAFADPDAVALVEDQLREKLLAAQARLHAGPLAPTDKQPAPELAARSGVGVIVIAVLLVVLALALVMFL